MTVQSVRFQKKANRQFLQIQFEEGDDILESIQQAMEEHNVSDAMLVECKGHIKDGRGNYLQGNQLMTKEFNNTEIKVATGNFKVSKKGMLGILKFIPTDLDNHVTLANGTAAADLEIKLSYYVF